MRPVRGQLRGATAPSPPPDEPDNAPAHASQMATPAPVDVRSLALTVLTFLGTIVVLKYAQAMIIPIVLGVLISYALDPLVARLGRLHIPRSIAAALVLVTVVGAGCAVMYRLRSEADAIVQQLPAAAAKLRRTLEREKASGNASTLTQM